MARRNDEYDERPRFNNVNLDNVEKTLGVTLIITIALVVVFAAGYVLGYRRCQKTAALKTETSVVETAEKSEYPKHDSLGIVYTYNGEDPIRVYVFTDSDTGLQYLITDKGGVCLREGLN